VGPTSTTDEPPGLAALDQRAGERALLAEGVAVDAGRGLQQVARLGGLVVRLGHHGVDAVLEQAVSGLLEEEPPDHADHARREDQRARDDAGLDRTPPEGQPSAHGLR